MQIDHNILITYGGFARKYEKGAIIFHKGSMPHFFYQIVEGEVKVFSSNNEGKVLTQGIFTPGCSFGEPPLLLSKPYPSTAQTTIPSVVVKIAREHLLEILKDYPELSYKLLYAFAERIYGKATSAQVWVSSTPEEKIICFLNNHRESENSNMQLVPFTRQQIADFTGLRVETVIRTLSRMSRENKVKIVDHKLYYRCL